MQKTSQPDMKNCKPSSKAILEKAVEQYLVARVKACDGLCPKWISPGNRGVPDRIILLPGGVVIFAELKRPVGGRPGALQQIWLRSLTRLGFRCITLSSRKDIDALLAEVTA